MPDVEILQLRLAELELPDSHPEGPGRDTVHGFLVRDRDACVLVDTGVGVGSVLIERLYQPRRIELSAALAEAGASLSEITAVVNSHLHFDHCGNNRLFPGVPIFVQEAELEAARRPHYTVPDWVFFPGTNYVPVRGTHPLSEHLEIVPTPGHTPGHQSLVVRSPKRTEIIAAQAAYTAAEFQLFRERLEGRSVPAFDRCIASNATWSAESYLNSLETIERLRPDRALFSHDDTVWKRE